MAIQDGDPCRVIAGTHKGKEGTAEERHVSKDGNVTITVRQADGSRFKTLERGVELRR